MAGVTLDIHLPKNWALHTGLEVNMKGFELLLSNYSTLTTTAVYMQLPVDFGYRINVGKKKKWNIEPRLGFYLAYGVAGNSDISGTANTLKTFGDDILKNMDAGMTFGIYLDNNRFRIGMGGRGRFQQNQRGEFPRYRRYGSQQ